ncbi:MAG: FHA domain-containing protein [Myxococcaceae bacterium]
MGFQLVIAEGKEAGREFEFDQASVVIGRTAECDVILYEAGVSRKHARIALEGASFIIEDLGSSNGTRVNGSPISGKATLKDGDSIAMGPVVFNFKPVDLAPEVPTDEQPLEEGGAHTRIVSVSEMKKSRNKGVAMLPKGANRDEVAEMGRRSTQMIPALKGPRPSAPSGKRPSTSGKQAQLAKSEADLPEGVSVAGGGRPSLSRASGERPALSAADRARYKRAGAIGRAQLFWETASKPVRIATAGGLGLLGLALIGGLIAAAIPNDAKPKPKEPTIIGADPIEYSFGLGPDVMFENADQKSFDFEVKSPVAVMVVLHYASKDINSKEEVSIAVNGVEVGWLPPDTLDSGEKQLEVIIPANLVKRDDINTVTFDNVRNPPEEDTWMIRSLWIEIAVLPEKDEAGLKADAEEKYKRGMVEWEQRDIGASNRWDAYKNFREAWLTLEAIPGTRPYTYQLSRDKMQEARRALDEKCRELLLKARSAFNFGKFDEARYELDHIKDFFPTNNHPCQYKAEVERQQMDL